MDLRRWLLLLRIPMALGGVAIFFTLYNRFILDANLQNLKVSLSVLNSAANVGQAEAALFLVDQTLVAEMAREDADLKTLSVLQYAQGTLGSGERQRPAQDTRAMVAAVVQEAERPGLLAALDGLAAGTQSAWQQAVLLPRRLMGGGSAIAKLRQGYMLQRTGDLVRAERLYREALQETADAQELRAARQMLTALAHIRGKEPDVRAMEQRLSILGPGPERQRAAFQLGSLLIQVFAFEKAARTFREATQAAPQGKLALPSLLKEGWCLRASGDTEGALNRFQELIQKDSAGDWAATACLQLAQIYQAAGDKEGALQSFEKAIATVQDKALLAALLAQAGSFALYDLKNPEKAAGFFSRLASKFPASPYSGIPRNLPDAPPLAPVPVTPKDIPLPAPGAASALEPPQQQPEAAAIISLAADSSLMKWLEQFLPIFVEVFSERLIQYMEAVGKKSLTREFTEVEFKDLVLRRVQGKFAGYVSSVNTRIHPDGFIGSATVRLGELTFPVEARIGISVVDEKAHAVIEEIKMENLVFSPESRLELETRINIAIDQQRYPLKIKKYELYEGYALISVELTEEKSGRRPADQILF